MKYKVGDKVRVRKDIITNKIYGRMVFVEGMCHLIGGVVSINEVLEDSYHIDEEIYYITDEMLEDVEEEFKLPENGRWCIKATAENIGILGDYWDEGCGLSKIYSHEDTFRYDLGKYWCSYNLASGNLLFSESPGSNHIISSKPEGLLEITTEQFKKYVLREIESTPVKEEVKVNTLEQSRESLLEEAKRRYPAGTRYYGFNGVVYQIEEKDKLKFFDSGQSIAVGKAFVYHKSKWAEIVESPTVQQKITPNDLAPMGGWYPKDTYDRIYTIGLDPVADESIKNKGESKSTTNESDFPIISTKRIINFSQLT